MPTLYADVILSIMLFLKLEDLPSAIRLNRQWNESIRTLKLGSTVRQLHRFDHSLELTKRKWKGIKRHPNSALLKHVTAIDVQYCPDYPGFLPAFFPSLRSVSVVDRNFFISDDDSGRLRTNAAIDAIRMNEKLTSIDIGSNAVDDEDVSRIADSIKQAASDRITSLDLSNNRLRDAGFCSMAEVIKNSKGLTCIKLGFNLEIRASGAAAIADALKKSESLTSFDIAGNQLDFGCVQTLADGVSFSKCLTILHLGFSSIQAADAWLIAQAIENSTSITTVDLSNNELRNLGAAALAHAIKHSRSLTHVDLSANQIGDEGASYIADALSTNESLLSLNLRGNHIGDPGASAISEAIKSNRCLTTLDLRDSFFQVNGVSAFVDALTCAENKTLTSVDLRGNKICAGCASHIDEVLHTLNKSNSLNISAGGRFCDKHRL